MGHLSFAATLRYESGFLLDVRFEAGDGVTALCGRSGSGKTTIIELIAGSLRPQGGAIRLGSRTLVDVDARVFLPPEQRRIGVVFQDHLLFPHMSVRSNLLFGKGRAGARTIELDRVVDILQLGDVLNRLPAALSGGQRQRVALGRALLRGPELLLMDEPLAALDRELKDRILTYLELAVAEWHVPTLFVSHDQADVHRFAERVVVIEGGKISNEGTCLSQQ